MDLSPYQRLELFWQSKHLKNASAFADSVDGLTASALSAMKQRRSMPSAPVMRYIQIAYPDLSADYVLWGEEPMLLKDRALAPADTPKQAAPAAPTEPAAPTPGLTSGPATVAEAENILLRERLADKDIIIEMLRAELGKSNDSPEAAGPLPTNPRKPIGGFMTEAQRAELAEAFNEFVEQEQAEGAVVVSR